MKYVFLGSPNFAARVLRSAAGRGLIPIAVIANPDRPTGRKKTLTPPPAKLVAQEYGIPCFQPEKPAHIAEEMRNLAPDMMVVAAYSHILKNDFLKIPKMGTMGVHPSLLPELRGASPIQSAILRGDSETGVTLYLLDDKVDHGPVLAQKKVIIGNLYYQELENILADLGGEMLAETLPAYLNGKISARPQPISGATFTSKFSREDGFIDTALLRAALNGESLDAATEINNKIRALAREPGAWTNAKGLPGLNQLPETEVKILRSRIDGGKLIIEQVQAAGKNPQIYKA